MKINVRSAFYGILWVGISSGLAAEDLPPTPASPAAPPPVAAASSLLKKEVETFSAGSDWIIATTSSAQGQLQPNAEGGAVLKIAYSGKGMEVVNLQPPSPLYIPGNLRSVTLRIKSGGGVPGIKLICLDGYGRGDVKGTYLQPSFAVKSTSDWQTLTIPIPDDWVRPVAISGLLFHNYTTRTIASQVEFSLGGLEIETDVSGADPQTGRYLAWQPAPEIKPGGAKIPETPWLAPALNSTAVGNLFAGTSPEISFVARNWRAAPISLALDFQVADEAGKVVFQDTKTLDVDAAASVAWKPALPKFGPYWAKMTLRPDKEAPTELSLRLASIPAPRKLSEEQKLASPYGLNYHAGNGVMAVPFAEAGVVWFREYAFQWDWLDRARGEDNRYNGWPFFQNIAKAYRDAGVIMMPVFQKSIPLPSVENGKVVGATPPSPEWVRKMSSIILAFPDVHYWELDNEYDLPLAVRNAEEMEEWSHYADYHRKFGEILRVVGSGQLTAVENGQSGIHTDLSRKMIASGAFDDIGVLNVHHYTGVEPPETNFGNFNTDLAAMGGNRMRGQLSDALREFAQIAKSGAKPRQAWWTEFGWDTLVGKVVTEQQQAAYLPRAFMIAAAAGVDKSFWFNNFDAANPVAYFDGCGLMTARAEPKPSLCALAGMTSLLPQLHAVGGINAGPGTYGFVFEQDGALVASLWRILPGDPVNAVFDGGAKLYDLYANPLPGNSADLTIDPVYAVGISRESPWYLQTAYSLETLELMSGSSGDKTELVLAIKNNRTTPIDCDATLQLPPGWTGPAAPLKASVAPGQSARIPLPFTIGADEKTGKRELAVLVKEGGAPVKMLPVHILLREPFDCVVGALRGDPGPADVNVSVINQSSQPGEVTLTLSLPKSWKAVSAPVRLEGLQPGEKRQATLSLVWSADSSGGEKPEVVLTSPSGYTAAKPLIPPLMTLSKVDGPGWFGGDAASWPKKNSVPDAMLGSTLGAAGAKVWLGWTEAGLWVALQVDDTKVQTSDPTMFWAADSLELFVDTGNRKGDREFSQGDYHFWLVPQEKEGRVYLGRWKHGEMKETLYDIPNIKSVSRCTPSGYAMEVLIPWTQLDGASPQAGGKMGFNFNLNVRGPAGDREVFWPASKAEQVGTNPGRWGTLELAP